jgi:RNA polymerase sigma factor (sigma-70 family)
MSDETVTTLLERLSSGRVDAAWSEFLARYTPLLMRVIRRHCADEDHASECFAHVCSELSDDGFRRLRSFRPDGPARFETWLMAVASNLSVDWRRKERGRARPPNSVSRLPELDQQVFRRIYLRGMSRAQCHEDLAPRFPGLTLATVSEINGRLFTSLTPQQRWQLSTRCQASPRPSGRASADDEDPVSQVEEPGPGPDEQAAEMQAQKRLQDALARLPAEQRFLLRLRYEQGLTLAQVARLTGQPDLFRADRQIRAALDALASLMGGHGFRSGRKNR